MVSVDAGGTVVSVGAGGTPVSVGTGAAVSVGTGAAVSVGAGAAVSVVAGTVVSVGAGAAVSVGAGAVVSVGAGAADVTGGVAPPVAAAAATKILKLNAVGVGLNVYPSGLSSMTVALSRVSVPCMNPFGVSVMLNLFTPGCTSNDCVAVSPVASVRLPGAVASTTAQSWSCVYSACGSAGFSTIGTFRVRCRILTSSKLRGGPRLSAGFASLGWGRAHITSWSTGIGGSVPVLYHVAKWLVISRKPMKF